VNKSDEQVFINYSFYSKWLPFSWTQHTSTVEPLTRQSNTPLLHCSVDDVLTELMPLFVSRPLASIWCISWSSGRWDHCHWGNSI